MQNAFIDTELNVEPVVGSCGPQRGKNIIFYFTLFLYHCYITPTFSAKRRAFGIY